MEMLVVILLNALLLSGLWWLYFVEYRQLKIDETRQRLFAIRDDLFRDVANGLTSFDDKAYVMTRRTLNGMIQFAHELSMLRFMVTLAAIAKAEAKGVVLKYGEELADAMENTSPEARKRLHSARRKMHYVIVTHMVQSSILIASIIYPAVYFARAMDKWKELRHRLLQSSKSGWLYLDAEASKIAGNDRATCG